MTSIYSFENYRDFLKIWVLNQPKRGRGIYKKWAEILRIEPSALSQVLSGKRSFNLDQGYQLTNELGLSELDSEYFDVLIQIELANTKKLQNHLQEKLKKIRRESLNLSKRLTKEKVMSDEEKSIFYSSWIYSAVRIATSINDFNTVEQISSRLKIKKEKTQEVLNFLVKSGLVQSELGAYKLGPQRTHVDRNSPHVVKHHSNWRVKAIQRCENLNEEELMFSGPLTISKKDFKIIREKIVSLISSVSETVKETQPEDLAYFGVDLFWIE